MYQTLPMKSGIKNNYHLNTCGRKLRRKPKFASISNLPPDPIGIACLYLQGPAVPRP